MEEQQFIKDPYEWNLARLGCVAIDVNIQQLIYPQWQSAVSVVIRSSNGQGHVIGQRKPGHLIDGILGVLSCGLEISSAVVNMSQSEEDSFPPVDIIDDPRGGPTESYKKKGDASHDL